MADLLFSFVKFACRSRFKKPKIYGMDNFKDDVPAIFLSNHEYYYGPIMVTTRFPVPVRQWAIADIIGKEEAREYVTRTLFNETLRMKKGGLSNFLGNIASKPISWAIRNANPIAAHQDPKKSYLSVQNGLDVIKNGENQLMFAKRCKPTSDEFELMQGFVMLAKMASRKLGINPNLYPVSLNRDKVSIAISKPTILDPDEPFKREVQRVNDFLKENIRLGYVNPEMV